MGDQGIERAVETNQKHLIKKILARYPTQWTFFRELVQNADDAQAKEVRIEFFTDKLTHTRVINTVVSNNGNPFSPEDWNRLCSIASGNPDPQKVGFFGVGFYSVFALSDAPSVESGFTRLDFFWKGNALYTREHKLKVPLDEWTRFLLPVEDVEQSSSPLPNFDEIGTFLAELLCFSKFTRSVKVLSDGLLKVGASRTDTPLPLSIPFPPPPTASFAYISNPFKDGGIKLSPVGAADLVLTKLEVEVNSSKGSLSLIRGNASFDTSVSDRFARLYLDMTQKRHPSRVTVSVLLSLERRRLQSSNLLNDLNPNECKGKVFVGFITSQTVGMGVHVSGPFVPTMEREHLDFSNEVAKVWNLTLFQSVGKLNRVVYDALSCHPGLFPLELPLQTALAPQEEILEDDGFWGAMKRATKSMFTALVVVGKDQTEEEDDTLMQMLETDGKVCVLGMAIFCPIFTECRPFPGALKEMWAGFLDSRFESGPLVWTCQGKALPCDRVRLFPRNANLPQLSSIETFPVVSSHLSKALPASSTARLNFSRLVSCFLQQLVSDQRMFYFTLTDILDELKSRPLRGMEETKSFLTWFTEDEESIETVSIQCSKCGSIFPTKSNVKTMSCPTCFCKLNIQPKNGGDLAAAGVDKEIKQALWEHTTCLLSSTTVAALRLKHWKWKLDPKLEPVLPLVLESLPPIWKEEIVPLPISKNCPFPPSLVRNFTSEVWISAFFSSSPEPSKVFSVLHCLSQDSENLPVLKKTKCVPTSVQTLALPSQVYTTEIEQEPNALVLAKFPKMANWKEVDFLDYMRQLGVRESISPELMVMLFSKGKVSRQVLWQFIFALLITQKQKLDPPVLGLLKNSKCCGRIGGSPALEYFPHEVYLPSAAVSELSQYLPVLCVDVPDVSLLLPFFTHELKVPAMPANGVLIQLIARNDKMDTALRVKALHLLYQNNVEQAKVYFQSLDEPVIPCVDGVWRSPKMCFLSVPKHLPQCSLCHQDLLHSSFQDVKRQLGIHLFPPLSLSIDVLAKQPTMSETEVEEILDYLIGLQTHLTDEDFSRLKQIRLFPVDSTCVLFAEKVFKQFPSLCYFENKEDLSLQALFCFVKEERWKKSPHFYQRLGVKQAPTLNELVVAIGNRPKQIFEQIGFPAYVNLLRLIASAESVKIKSEILQAMKNSPCLVGHTTTVTQLYLPSEIIVEDDSRYRRLFAEVPACPNEVLLEAFYQMLGSFTISSRVEERSKIHLQSPLPLCKEAQILDSRLRERLPVLMQKCLPFEINSVKLSPWSQKRPCVVRQVDLIESNVHLSLPNKPVLIKSVPSPTCCVFENMVCVTKVDYFHVASSLVREFLLVRSNDRALLWATLLQSSNESLEEMGFVLPKEPPAVILPKRPLIAEEDAKSKPLSLPSPPRQEGDIFPPQKGKEKEAPKLPLPNPSPPKPSEVVPKTQLPPPPLLDPFRQQPLVNPTPPHAQPPPPQSRPLSPPSTTTTRPSTSSPRPPENIARFRDSAIESALHKCRPNDQAEIVDNGKQEPLRDAMLDCTQPHDLVRDPMGIGSIECFVPRSSLRQTSPFQVYMVEGREFANLLVQMCIEVFQLDPSVIHLFFDPPGTTRAFNLNGALFFNLFCFIHDKDTLKSAKSWKRWFGSFCHELSHNNWKAHDSQFANYLEVFCIEFMESLLTSLRVRGLLE